MSGTDGRYNSGMGENNNRTASVRIQSQVWDYSGGWYDPYLNRMTSPDSIIPDEYNPQSWDRFAYVLNNALKYTDPSGHFTDKQIEEWTGMSIADWIAYNIEFLDLLRLMLLGDSWFNGTSWGNILLTDTPNGFRLNFVNSEGDDFYSAKEFARLGTSDLNLYHYMGRDPVLGNSLWGGYYIRGKLITNHLITSESDHEVSVAERIGKQAAYTAGATAAGTLIGCGFGAADSALGGGLGCFPAGAGGAIVGFVGALAVNVAADLNLPGAALINAPGNLAGDRVLEYTFADGSTHKVVVRDGQIIFPK